VASVLAGSGAQATPEGSVHRLGRAEAADGGDVASDYLRATQRPQAHMDF
jgi:hypothetical protein